MPRFKFSEIVNNVRESRAPTPADEASYIGLEHLDSGSLFVSRWGSDVPLKGHKLQMKKGDLLFGKRNAYLRRAAIAPHDGLFSAHGMVFRPNVKVVDKRLFPFFVGSDAVFDAAIRISVGSLSPTVNWRDLAELEFELPPLEVQPVIAEKLWATNETRESYKRLLSIIDDLVKSQFVEMFGDPVKNPKGWEEAELGKRMDIITGNTPPRANPNYYGTFVEWIKSDNISEDTETLSTAEESLSPDGFAVSRHVNAGALLMTCIAGSLRSIGNVVMTNRQVAFNQQINALVPQFDNPVFLLWLLRIGRSILHDGLSISLKGILNKGLLSGKRFPFPPRNLQDRFAAFVAAADKSKFAVRKSLAKLDAVYKALSKEAFG